MLYPNYRLLVFSKSPELGRVKTRMQPELSQQQSKQLHTHLVQHCLRRWHAYNLLPIDLWVGGDIPLFQQQVLSPLSAELQQLTIQAQPAGDLGKRMAFAVNQTLAQDNVDGVLLVGTDCPFINKMYLNQAIAVLDDKNKEDEKNRKEKWPVVIGPALDGGYVLLGLSSPCNALFQGIAWGTETVLESTRKRIVEQGLLYQQLPVLRDIDDYDDLSKSELINKEVDEREDGLLTGFKQRLRSII